MKTVNNPPQEVEFNSRLNNWLNDLAQPSSLFYRHPHNNFTSAQVEKMKERIEREMEVNQPYLQPGFSISQLAKQTDIHPNQLSAFINQQYQMRYTDFVNQYRIQYFKKKLMEEESWKYLTLQAIAKAAGFGNRNTFTKAFKKHDGTTPTEFLKKVKLNKTEAA